MSPFRSIHRYYSITKNILAAGSTILKFVIRNIRSFLVYRKGKSSDRIEHEIAFNIASKYASEITVKRNDIHWSLPLVDQGISKKIFSKGHYEGESIEFIANFLREKRIEEGIILDIGANIGVPSVPLASKLPGATIYAFEPIRSTYKILRRNIAINNLENRVFSFETALGSEDTQVHMQHSESSPATSEVIIPDASNLGSENLVNSTSLTSFVRANKIDIDRIRFAWIDIQGYEPELIKGGNDILSQIDLYIEVWPEGIERNGGKDTYLNFVTEYYSHFLIDDEMSSFANEPKPIEEFRNLYNSLKKSEKWCSVLLMK